GRDEREHAAAASDVDHGVAGLDLHRVGEGSARGGGAEHPRTEQQGGRARTTLPLDLGLRCGHGGSVCATGPTWAAAARGYTASGPNAASGPGTIMPVSTPRASSSSRSARAPVSMPIVPVG